ncbi:hypothetical protein BDZ97DRAFT_1918584 [Flammula alnicola]|nr:hypothetical protein BDZ97DRAFT_1918584 [Flammula alnicola]
MLVICACGSGFKRSGYATHVRQSKNPKCHAVGPQNSAPKTRKKKTVHIPENSTAPFTSTEADGDSKIPDQANASASGESAPLPKFEDEESASMNIDSRGDFFGDYDSYSPGDFGMVEDEGSDVEGGGQACGEVDQQEDAEIDDYEAAMADLESRLEAERTFEPQPSSTPSDSPGATADPPDEPTGPAMRLRGGAEEGLRSKPHVVHFPFGQAGKVYAVDGLPENERYREVLGGIDNPYSPFSSERDWLMAKWQKLRGPGSTAFDELMAIERLNV